MIKSGIHHLITRFFAVVLIALVLMVGVTELFSIQTQAATVKSIQLAVSTLKLGVGESCNFKYTLTPASAKTSLKWSSSAKAVASISTTGKIVAKKVGKTNITVMTSNGKKSVCKVVVYNAPTKLGLNKTSLKLGSGDQYNLNQTFASGQYACNVIFVSNNTAVATVNKTTGVVTAKALGTAVITAKSYNGRKATCKVVVGVKEINDNLAFSKALSKMTKSVKAKNSMAAQANDEFYSMRLIVRTNGNAVDFAAYKPQNVIKSKYNIFMVQFTSSKATKTAFAKLSNHKNVSWVEPDSYVGDSAITDYVTTSASYSWGVSKIGASSFASKLSKTEKVVVAVIDTGVSKHTFLNSRLVSGYDFVDNDSNPADLHSHGTHVAGTVVDCTPGLNVKIMPVRVLDANGSGYDSVIGSGIMYAADRGADIINLSLGGERSNYIDTAVNYAVNKGVTVVAAAGNEYDNTSKYSPAHLSNIIVVGAVDSNNKRASFSNVGSSVDVVAPGVDVVSCIPGGRYALKSGTSMASPHIAAAAAMIKIAYPSYIPAQIESTIKKYTKDLGASGWDKQFGYGLPILSSIPYKNNTPVAVTGVSLNKTSVTLNSGSSISLSATVSPSNATNKTLTWSSSNSSVATVSGGKITAKSAGTTTITVRTSNGKSASCSVMVVIPPTSVSLSKSSVSLYVGETVTLSATVSPSNATDKSLTWSSSSSVATVSGGKITAKSAGTTTVTVRTSNGKTATCKVTVTKKAVPADGISLNRTTYSLNVRQAMVLTATVTPNDATDKSVTWSSNNSDVATVSNGVVTAVSGGSATITAKTSNGKTAQCVVTVRLTKIAAFGLGRDFSGIITESGDLYTFGENNTGQLGIGSTDSNWDYWNTDNSIPVKILSNVKMIDFGSGSGFALTESGDLYSWGANNSGQLGDGTTTYRNRPQKIMSSVKSLSYNNEHVLAIKNNGDLYAWGDNYYGQLSSNAPYTGNNYIATPTKIMTNVISAAAGQHHSAAVLSNGDLYTWGFNNNGECGTGKREFSHSTPVKILSNVKSVSAEEITAAVLNNGDLYICGFNDYGHVGNGTNEDVLIPQKIMSNISSVSAGGTKVGAVTTSGQLYTWGGSGKYTPSYVASNVKGISMGTAHNGYLTSNGELYLWGENNAGCIGLSPEIWERKNSPYLLSF